MWIYRKIEKEVIMFTNKRYFKGLLGEKEGILFCLKMKELHIDLREEFGR